MRYFDTAARHPHDDEEQDLFPALLDSMAGSDAACLRELTASLCLDQRQLEQRWAALRERLSPVTQDAASTLADADVPGFVQSYEQHIIRLPVSTGVAVSRPDSVAHRPAVQGTGPMGLPASLHQQPHHPSPPAP